ncbi:MAG: hypothetical protein H0U52_06795 [Chloroflexi bacterium]|nr:hypothetical protein [Chloroflexota bacterium]
MPNDVASQATWQINSASQGNKKLRRVQSYDISDGSSVEAVGEVGSDRMVAFRRKPGAKTISFEIAELKVAKREVNWEYLEETGEVVSLTKQVVSGIRTQYPEAMVSKIDFTGDVDGKHMYTVEIIALERKGL